jgi:hypothetical protein
VLGVLGAQSQVGTCPSRPLTSLQAEPDKNVRERDPQMFQDKEQNDSEQGMPGNALESTLRDDSELLDSGGTVCVCVNSFTLTPRFS